MKTFETFLRVTAPVLADEAPVLDDAWMIERGIAPTAPAVLKHLRDDVAPLLETLFYDAFPLEWFSFLVHAYPLVPTTPDDAHVYIHLRLGFDEMDEAALVAKLPPGWLMTRSCELGEIAGVDSAALDNAWDVLNAQSVFLLDFIKAHAGDDLATLVKHTRQFLHFFANMTQMRAA